MLDFLNRWRLREDTSEEEHLPWPVTQQGQGPSSASSAQLDISAISPPIPRSGTSSLTGFSEEHVTHWQHYRQPSPIRRPGVGPRLRVPSEEKDDEEATTVQVPPPAVVRADGANVPRPSVVPHGHVHPIPMARSASSPPSTASLRSPSPSPSTESTTTATSNTTTKMKLKLQPPEIFSQSTHSLRLDSQPHSVNTDMYGNSYNYPLAKQLSPIAEQDYISPGSTRQSTGLPSREGSQNDLSRSTSAGSASGSPLGLSANASPDGSQGSEITRPSPSYSSPFITRQLNRTTSQTSSRTHVSTTSNVVTRPPPGGTGTTTTKSSEPPSIPPLDLRPPFPGPHPSQNNGSGPPLRPCRSTMSVIAGSAEGHYDEDPEEYGGDHESLHADSFVTATSKDRVPGPGGSSRRIAHEEGEEEEEEEDEKLSVYGHRRNNPSLPSIRSIRSQAQSTNESFIARRWDRDAALGSGRPHTFRAKRQWITVTPAFWAFWLGFLCPVLWLVGGWHFTNFGEQPPRLTFWEFYFNAGYWKEKFCGGRNKKRDLMVMNSTMMGMTAGEGPAGEGGGGGKKAAVQCLGPPLPKWVAEKQASEDGRARLNDPKRSLRGISFGYPFISRPVQCSERTRPKSWFARTFKVVVSKPNRVFDHLLYGVKLKEVRGRPESGRRMFDPWIQRCRYALCYAGVVLAIGLITVSTYLIVFNTRNLR